MKPHSAKDPAVAHISAHIKTHFPKLTLTQAEYKSSTDFRGKQFRELSLSENLIFELNRVRKTLPEPLNCAAVALKIAEETSKPTFLALLSFFYSKVR